MGLPHTFSLRRSLNSWVSSWMDFRMLGALLGAAALLAGCMSSRVNDASWSLAAQHQRPVGTIVARRPSGSQKQQT